MLAIEVSVSEDAIGCVRRDAGQWLGHADKRGAVFVVRSAGCFVLDRRGCI